MGYPTQQQKVDYLFKKIGFTKTKTGVAEDQTSGFSGDTKKAPPNEAIASPLIIPSGTIWSDSSFITATPPTSDTAYVGVYSTATSYRMTVDTTVANERTFIARQTWGNPSSAIDGDWIDTQFGADYLVKVYMGDPSTGDPGVAYTNLSAAGTTGKDDVWFFDYSSGVLNFNGADLDGQLVGIHTDNVYLVGYRYIGRKGIQPAAGIGTFHDLVVSNNLSVGGISTFTGLIDANGLIEATAGENKIPSLYNDFSNLPNAGTYHGMFAHVHTLGRGYFAHAGNWMELVNKETSGIVGTGTEKYNLGFTDTVNLKATGITTLGSIGISTGRITGPAVTYIDPATVGVAGTVVILGNLQVDGTYTVVNSSTMTVVDKNIEIAKGAANDAAADGAGITVDSGDGDKTWNWVDATDSWTSSEHIRVAAGKVFGFADDPNTYIDGAGNDSINFTTNGTRRVSIISDGNVGIGSTDPQELLSLMANGPCGVSLLDSGHGQTATTIKIGNQGKDLSIIVPEDIQSTLTNGNYKINQNGSETFRITGSTGNVGINSGSPTAKLDVIGNTKLQGNLNVTGISTFNDDAHFVGASAGVTSAFWDASANSFKFYDNVKLELGDSQDLQLYHNGSGSYFDNNTGPFYIRNNVDNDDGGNIIIEAKSGKASAVFQDDEGVRLYFNNAERFSTTDSGVSIGSSLTVAGVSTFSGDVDADGNLSLAGVSTFTGNIDANGDLDVDGRSELDIVNISETLNVSGITTISKEVGIGSALNVVGVSTFNDDVTITKDKDLIFDRFGTIKTRIRYNDTLVTTQIYNSDDGLEIGYRPAHLMWLTNRVLSTKLGGIHVHGDLETDSVSTINLNSTGISTFAGKVSAGGTTGTDGYYLKTTGIGVTWAAFPNSRTGLTTSATAGQTTFNFSYNVGYVDVFLNGVKLPESEFVASNGSTIVLGDAAFANDTLEFVSYNTVPNSSEGAQNLDGLADVTITGDPIRGETLQHNGTKFVNDYSPHTTTNSTSDTFIAGFSNTDYRSAEYLMQIRDETASPDHFHLTKLLIIHDGTNVYFNEYGTLFSHSSLATFTVVMNGSNVQVRATPASSNTMVFKYKFTGIKDAS